MPVRRSDDGRGVATLVIDVPATRNALGVAILESINTHLSVIADDATARVIVITATRAVFSSGADRTDLSDPVRADRLATELTHIVDQLAASRLPVVCRVNGDAYGGGLALLGGADLVIAAEHARFAFPEVRLGMVATVAAATCVPRLGRGAALDLLLTGRRFDALEAQRLGLVTSVAAANALDDTVETMTAALLLGEPAALDRTKQLVRHLV